MRGCSEHTRKHTWLVLVVLIHVHLVSGAPLPLVAGNSNVWHRSRVRRKTTADPAVVGGAGEEEFNLESSGDGSVKLPAQTFELRREVWEVPPLESENVQSLARLAAKEVRRYLYLTSGSIHHLKSTTVEDILKWTRSDEIDKHPKFHVKEVALVLASTTASELIQALDKEAGIEYAELSSDLKQPLTKQELFSRLSTLAEEEHVIQTLKLNDPGTSSPERSSHHRLIHLITGGGPSGMLFAAYRFAETALGVRFLPHGDVLPDITSGSSTCRHTSPSAVAAGDKDSTFNYRFRCSELPAVSEVNRPVYANRGVLWWPKFAEGVDTWNHTEYRMHLEQLVKMRLNFVSIHSAAYAEDLVEDSNDPVVWMGLTNQVAPNGHVNGSYASALFSTCRGEWGYHDHLTGEYAFGLKHLFESDCWAGPAQVGEPYLCPFPKSPEAKDEVFNRVGDLLGASFTYARDIGLRLGMGIDAPVKAPSDSMEANLEGMFVRLQKLFPQLEEFWLWTPKEWATSTLATSVTRPVDILTTVKAAISAHQKTQSTCSLGIAGNALGPLDKQGFLGDSIAEDMSVVLLDGHNGREGLNSEWSFYGQTQKKWEVVWMEDESGLTTTQFWVRRTLERTKSASKSSVEGMLALHWRTRSVSPQMSAFASSMWENRERVDPSDTERERQAGAYQHELKAHEFWLDWVTSHFGVTDHAHMNAMASAFAFHDGDSMPRPAKWDGGPGALDADISQCDWHKRYAWVDNFATQRNVVSGVANLARFDQWVSIFAYVRSMAKCSCVWGQYDSVVHKKTKAANSASVHEQSVDMAKLVHLRGQLMSNVTEVMGHLLTHCSTMGELGTIINLLSHSFASLIGPAADKALRGLLDGIPLRKALFAPQSLSIPPRIIMPGVRSTLEVGESLFAKVYVLSTDGEQPEQVTLWVRSLYDDHFHDYAMDPMEEGRHVYSRAVFLESDFEFYVTAVVGNTKLTFPVTAPVVCHTIVIRP